MELKVEHAAHGDAKRESFNRTFMELKGFQDPEVGTPEQRFNRTFMELKVPLISNKANELSGFNRTFMELKVSNDATRNVYRGVSIAPLWN